ncbi:MAG: hypothetical protein ABI675_25715 [Chitinophagaceae bacterium]
MGNKKNQSKSEIAQFFLQMAEEDSRDNQSAREFLASEGANVDRMLDEGMQKIRRALMESEAKRTEIEMKSTATAADRAIKWVDELLNKVDFSFSDFVKKEDLVVSFRNVESLSDADKRGILIKYFTLKFSNEKKDKD